MATDRLTWRSALGVTLVVLVLAEGGMRLIGDHLPRRFSGDTVEIELKYDQLEALAAAGEPVDVVFLGNSTLDAAVDPAVFAEASVRYDAPYNAALLGAPLPSVRRWTSDFVLAEVSPDTVVIGVTPLDIPTNELFGVSKTSIEAAFEASFDSLQPSRLHWLEEEASKRSVLVRERSAFRAPVELWRGITDTIAGREKQFNDLAPVTLEDGRVVPRDRETWERELLLPRGGNTSYWGYEFDGVVTRRLSTEERRTFETSTVNLEQLQQVIDAVTDGGVHDVVLVIPPHDTPALEDTGVPLDAFHRVAGDLVRFGEERDLPVLDFSEVVWEHRFFYDPAHLSKAGTERFTAILARELDRL